MLIKWLPITINELELLITEYVLVAVQHGLNRTGPMVQDYWAGLINGQLHVGDINYDIDRCGMWHKDKKQNLKRLSKHLLILIKAIYLNTPLPKTYTAFIISRLRSLT